MVSRERTPREASIDLVRGADVLLMLFVNEMAGVRGTPGFLLHTPPDGWSTPSTREVAAPSRPRGGSVLMTVGVVLAWLAPARNGASARQALRVGGAVLLVALVFLYRSRDATGLIQIRPHWWGILGLIGWSYLVAASLYVLARDRPALLLGAVELLYCVYLADEAGQARWLVALAPYLRVGRAVASHSAIAVSGTLLGVLLLRIGARARRRGRSWARRSATPQGSPRPERSCTRSMGSTAPSG
jgi:hypothetical protein